MPKKIITIHAGHNPSGKVGCGAIDILDESKEARVIAKKVIKRLRIKNIVVYNCTVNDGISQSDILKKIVQKCNKYDADLNVSIHFNSGRNDRKGDNKNGGTEVWLRTEDGIRKKVGTEICKRMEKIGFSNRGIKITKSLYFLNHTKDPAILIEVCFVDDKDDAMLYRKKRNAIAKAITKAILKAIK